MPASEIHALLQKQETPLNPSTRRPVFISLLITPRMLAAILGSFMQSFILTELESTLPLYLAHLFTYNSSQIGLIFLILSLPSFLAPLVGFLSDNFYGAKKTVCLGFLLLCPSFILLRLVDHNTPAQLALLCVLLLAIGVAVNMILTPVFAEAKEVVDEGEAEEPGKFGENGAYAQAFAMMNMAYAAGSFLGPLCGAILVERIGWASLTLGTGFVCAVCVGPCALATGGKRKDNGSLSEE